MDLQDFMIKENECIPDAEVLLKLAEMRMPFGKFASTFVNYSGQFIYNIRIHSLISAKKCWETSCP